jgi:hypothetical protein
MSLSGMVEIPRLFEAIGTRFSRVKVRHAGERWQPDSSLSTKDKSLDFGFYRNDGVGIRRLFPIAFQRSSCL